MKFIRNLSIHYKIILYFIILIIIPFSTMIALQYSLSTKNLTTSLSKDTNQMISQIENSIDFYILELEKLSKVIISDDDVLHFADVEHHFDYDETTIRKLLSSITQSHPEIVGIMLLNKKDIYISSEMYRASRDPLTTESWYQEAIQSSDKMTLISRPIGRNIRSYHDYSSDDVITAIFPIQTPNSEPTESVIVFDMSLSIIESLIEDIILGTNGFTFIVGDQHNIIYTPENPVTHRIDTRHFDGKNEGAFSLQIQENIYNVFFTTSTYTHWKTVGVFQEDDIYAEVHRFRNYTFVIGFLTIILAIFFARMIDSSVSIPIIGLKDSMKEVESGNLDVRYSWDSKDEIGQLTTSFNGMVEEIHNLVSLVEQEQRQIVDAELRVLQAQIKPHFLYNTLDTIIWLSREQNATEITDVTVALSNLFRIGLSKGQEFILYKDEIEHVKSYLLIQKARYEEDLHYHIDFDDALKEFKVLKLILQPIVENSIYHGIKEKDTPGMITIFSTVHENILHIHVRDDGVGMLKERVDALNEQLSYPIEEGSIGYGLINIQKRLQLNFGPTYGISLHSIEGFGTEVIIKHPLLRGDTNVKNTYS